MKILAIGAHADDVELGCGGALSRWRGEGHSLTLLVLSPSGYTNPKGAVIRDPNRAKEEARMSARALGAELVQENFETFQMEFDETLNSCLTRNLEIVRPDLVLSHWVADSHHDHRSVALSTLHSAKHIRKVLSYRSNWYAGSASFDSKYYVDISAHLEKKIELMKIFDSEMSRTGGKWERWIRSQAALEGMSAGCEAAEAFQLVKWVE